MLESLDFHYDGISSKDMGLMSVKLDSGLFEEIFLPSRNINEVKVKGNDKSYFQSVERDNISLPLTFLMPDGYAEDQERKIKRWFNQDYYKPFYFDDYPHRMFYVMYKGDSRISHNGLGQGYFTIELASNSPYSYSPVYSSPFIEVDGEYDFEFENDGDLDVFPEIWIKNKSQQENIKIHNLSNGIKFEFTGKAATLIANEQALPTTDLTNISADAKLLIIIDGTNYEINKASILSATGENKNITHLINLINTAIGTSGFAENDGTGRIKIASFSKGLDSIVTVIPLGSSIIGLDSAFGFTGNASTRGTGLALNETVYIDNEKKDIESDLPLTYRYDDFNGEYLCLNRGINRLRIFGTCEIQFRYQLSFLI
ncbi:hypothetical protein BAOM_3132 [Peribacillus asahii]|uniref:Phage tail protein n=1 Tax=Peribacillus asahii TaxID=228899 RepID=A0A3Q9RQ20_9BACI|nr:phage tail domain-containing protein [Peribacillus asahii]AZV43741.1 hypothetical protein BAOM_3132 [Peribacillus asahii]